MSKFKLKDNQKIGRINLQMARSFSILVGNTWRESGFINEATKLISQLCGAKRAELS